MSALFDLFVVCASIGMLAIAGMAVMLAVTLLKDLFE